MVGDADWVTQFVFWTVLLTQFNRPKFPYLLITEKCENLRLILEISFLFAFLITRWFFHFYKKKKKKKNPTKTKNDSLASEIEFFISFIGHYGIIKRASRWFIYQQDFQKPFI